MKVTENGRTHFCDEISEHDSVLLVGGLPCLLMETTKEMDALTHCPQSSPSPTPTLAGYEVCMHTSRAQR